MCEIPGSYARISPSIESAAHVLLINIVVGDLNLKENACKLSDSCILLIYTRYIFV